MDRTMGQPRKVIIDLDAGTDDAWALLMLLKCEHRYNYKVVGITCVHGNASVDDVVTNVLTVLSAINRDDVPVFKGAHEPFILPTTERVGGNFHGVNGFGDIQFPLQVNRAPLQEEHAVPALHRLLSFHRGNVDLICVGPLTNLALAIKMYPDIPMLVSGLYLMGGNRYGVGNVTCSAEFNFYGDPEAARIVLRQMQIPTKIVPWETCQLQAKSLPMTWRLNQLGANEEQPILAILNAIERKVYGERPNWMPCDAFLVAAYIEPECVQESVRCPADVELHGELTRGQMVLNHRREGQDHLTIIDRISDEVFRKLCWAAVE